MGQIYLLHFYEIPSCKNLMKCCRFLSILKNSKIKDCMPLVYSEEQQLQIINVLKNCAMKNSTRLFLNEKRLNCIQNFFAQNQNVKNIDSLLSINGFGPRILGKLCEDILLEQNLDKEVPLKNSLQGNISDKYQSNSGLISPSHITQVQVESLVSIQFGVNMISWAQLKLDSICELNSWGTIDLSSYADKKWDVHTVLSMVLGLRQDIPDADIYVMENNNWTNVSSSKKPIKYQIQDAMLTTALCSIFNQIESSGNTRCENENRVYFMQKYSSSRLFKKVVGTEIVSGQDIVEDFISGVTDERYQPVKFADDTVNQFFRLNGAFRDNLSRAFLMAVSFNELVLKMNPVALRTIRSARSRKLKTEADDLKPTLNPPY